jgi:hypothetical protein
LSEMETLILTDAVPKIERTRWMAADARRGL